MNIINVEIDFKEGICKNKGISVVTGDYGSTKVVFEFNKEATGTKVFEMKNPSDELVYADEIVDNEVVLVGYKEEEGQIETYSLFTEAGEYTFEVSLYQDNSKLTSVCGYIDVTQEQVIIDGEEVQEKITLFDNLMNDLSTKIEETNNLDIDAEKVEHTTTITLTKKDGTQEIVEILDGEKGDKGDKGDAGAIKFEIVQELPTHDIEEDTIYLVPIEPDIEGNNYEEYIYVNGEWELLGKIGVQVDLSNYYTKQEIDTMIGEIDTALTTLDIGSGVDGN